MKTLHAIALVIMPIGLLAQTPSAAEILRRVDANILADSKIVESKMIIHGRRGTRTVVAKSWQRGGTDSFTEYLSPPREKGTKMLKLGDRLWTYSPATDRTILISGHMLRQSVMGSDLSYEDMMEDPSLENTYDASIAGSEEIAGRPAWILDLKAKSGDVAYDKRRIWVDRERFIILRENLYAKSGKLLKQVTIEEVERVDDRWVARSLTFKDMLKHGDGTRMLVESIHFNPDIPDHIFSKAALRR
ncbi:MAG TPA: outer membrane lipoprotein-sorting protein [Candidatus Aminicenantes bacterium]|nr:outer membrane lipoprotein-sorting protein [Candidatus Aminicenantes bacterium]